MLHTSEIVKWVDWLYANLKLNMLLKACMNANVKWKVCKAYTNIDYWYAWQAPHCTNIDFGSMNCSLIVCHFASVWGEYLWLREEFYGDPTTFKVHNTIVNALHRRFEEIGKFIAFLLATCLHFYWQFYLQYCIGDLSTSSFGSYYFGFC